VAFNIDLNLVMPAVSTGQLLTIQSTLQVLPNQMRETSEVSLGGSLVESQHVLASKRTDDI
jgi:hypothetical protein